ncbi:transmembrane protein 255B isoform X2 [Peromyscus californicus insignis]|uniref:transmembrane protein 255B isoform X2 n=1 Tax=Peromyscus californicus insignis TaxID=564181 RepID=UPI0022A77EB8|nr:transmembrane protein 255B isoform X2 [Peromyscus californicus insignis]
MQPLPPPVSGPLALLDTTEGFGRRRKISLWFVGSLLLVSTLILTIGLAATTRTENVTVGGYYPGIILGFGSFLGIIGIHLVENRRQMEPRPLSAGRCQFYSSGTGYLYDVYQTEVTCYSLSGRCQLKVRSNTCYCCDLYACGSTESSPAYYEFVGVRSCQDVVHLYRLLWVSTVLNVLGLCLGIITAAVLGAFKDMVPLSQLAYGPSPPPQILYNPAQQILAYTGLCPPSMTVPTCSSYPLPLQMSFRPETLGIGLAWSAALSGSRVCVRNLQATKWNPNPAKRWLRAKLKPSLSSMFELFSHVTQTQCHLTAQRSSVEPTAAPQAPGPLPQTVL